jgi:ABC-type Zn2+ transport system substrate-binding protein/surface adhesin
MEKHKNTKMVRDNMAKESEKIEKRKSEIICPFYIFHNFFDGIPDKYQMARISLHETC